MVCAMSINELRTDKPDFDAIVNKVYKWLVIENNLKPDLLTVLTYIINFGTFTTTEVYETHRAVYEKLFESRNTDIYWGFKTNGYSVGKVQRCLNDLYTDNKVRLHWVSKREKAWSPLHTYIGKL